MGKGGGRVKKGGGVKKGGTGGRARGVSFPTSNMPGGTESQEAAVPPEESGQFEQA